MLYLDASAAIKLIYEEQESSALVNFINGNAEGLISSEVVRLEAWRVARRRAADSPNSIRSFESKWAKLEPEFELVGVDSQVINSATKIPHPQLATVDALHIASALQRDREISAFVTYDKRQATAAEQVGLKVDAPS